MRIRIDPGALGKTNWRDHAMRFLFGGIVTAAAGFIAKKCGPAVGGLFLAFPAIFPASATLIEKHEKQKKERAGLPPGHRGRDAAALDAAGAAMGSIGLLTFALLAWRLFPTHSAWLVLSVSAVAWFVVSISIWRVCSTWCR